MLTKDEITFAGLIKAMEDARRTAKAAGDLVSTAEIDRWFKEHAPIHPGGPRQGRGRRIRRWRESVDSL